MTEQRPQKDAMDVLQAFVDDYNARARPAIRLGSAGEAGGAQLRLRYSPADGQVSIFHMVAVSRNGRATMLVERFEGPTTETAVQAGLWASEQLGRRQSRFAGLARWVGPWARPRRGTGWGRGGGRAAAPWAGPRGSPGPEDWATAP